MGSMCAKCKMIENIDSDIYSLDTKMRTLNEMSKSTKFSSLKMSITYTNHLNYKLSESEVRDADDPIHYINNSRGRMKCFSFQEDCQNSLKKSQITDSPMTVKSETRGIKKKIKLQRDLIHIQNLDLSFYLQRNYQQQIYEEHSQKSILKSPLNRSFNSFSDQKKVHFATGTNFKTNRFQKSMRTNLTKIRKSLI
ncbi:unnamed protein product (macronuclear) [Paramecium tetraurelia]|uniref:Uncharacterized protein n=1 Tax=Paramecium tetraurelia TaxID=5888 RepID=A0BAN4_PARTE|nr:uncharacterized protein GSPATT00000036001 [Paramecium tetraurelia]CAK55601.1 unnamed protein product [Paramecium tetraurelia]|eukprot:XP_001422999.1 hypothetical protein (macronuclear) [Paramecium tetraurelia strain d4-2]